MIWEWKSCSIVMLTELEERGQVSAQGELHLNTSKINPCNPLKSPDGPGTASATCVGCYFTLSLAGNIFWPLLLMQRIQLGLDPGWGDVR